MPRLCWHRWQDIGARDPLWSCMKCGEARHLKPGGWIVAMVYFAIIAAIAGAWIINA